MFHLSVMKVELFYDVDCFAINDVIRNNKVVYAHNNVTRFTRNDAMFAPMCPQARL